VELYVFEFVRTLTIFYLKQSSFGLGLQPRAYYETSSVLCKKAPSPILNIGREY
jgi:hypothetical protein